MSLRSGRITPNPKRVNGRGVKNSYSPKFKFRVVIEAIQDERAKVEIDRAYHIHPTTPSNWKSEFMDKGPEVFGEVDTIKRCEKKISELDRCSVKKRSKSSSPRFWHKLFTGQKGG
ncbi:MAG: transposase [Candidatus Bipolaricaulota bacterium]